MACDCCPDPSAPGPTTGSPCCPDGGLTTGTPCPCCVVDCCCGLSTTCQSLTLTISNADDASLNGASCTMTCGTVIGPPPTQVWNGSIPGVSSSVTVRCSSSPTHCWDFNMTRGAGCTYSGPTAQVIDCANCTVTLKGITGAGISCEGLHLTVTLTWAC